MNIIESIENFSCDFEKLSSLINLSAFMMGKINVEGLPDNEEIRSNYPFWLESLLNTISKMADEQEHRLDEIIENMISK